MDSLTMPLSEEIPRAIQTLDFEHMHRTYWEQNECLLLEQFLPPEAVAHHFLPDVEQLRTEGHRNYIPKHKKGGECQLLHPGGKGAGFPRSVSLPGVHRFHRPAGRCGGDALPRR